MAKNDNHTASQPGIQVFALTMDNPEDQDELNRLLHKPGEVNNNPRQVTAPSTVEPAEKSRRDR